MYIQIRGKIGGFKKVVDNKKVDIKFSAHDTFLEYIHQVRSKSKDWKVK
jgi:hypothetical protein